MSVDAEKVVWCVLQVRSGCEDRVCEHIKKSSELSDIVEDVFVPPQSVPGSGNTKKGRAGRRVYAGYVFVRIDTGHHAYQKVVLAPNVLRFLMCGGDLRVVDQSEIEVIKNSVAKEEEIESGILVGDDVEIVDGPFEGFGGEVQRVEQGAGRSDHALVVSITIFGRPHSVRLNSSQVVKGGASGDDEG